MDSASYGKPQLQIKLLYICAALDFLNYGIMLGYVLVGPLIRVITAVKDAMTARKVRTEEHRAFMLDNSLCRHPHTHHSTHLQHQTALPITLIHVFLDFS